jgi:predicted phage tail protein
VFEKRKKVVIHRKNKKRSVEALRTAMAGLGSYMKRMDCSMVRASSSVTRKSLKMTEIKTTSKVCADWLVPCINALTAWH